MTICGTKEKAGLKNAIRLKGVFDRLGAYMNKIGNKLLTFLKIAKTLPPRMMIGRRMQIHSTSKTIKMIAQMGNLSFLTGCAGGVAT